MAALVQATCPGCKNVLRIPADWLSQSIKCKHCGMVLQARPAASPSPGVSSRTPVPRAKSLSPPPQHRPDAVPRPQLETQLVAVPVIPIAAAVESGSPFGNLRDEEDGARGGRRGRRRRRRTSWAGPLVVLTVLGIAAGVAFVNRAKIRELLATEASKNDIETASTKKEEAKTVVYRDKEPPAKMDETNEPMPEPAKMDKAQPAKKNIKEKGKRLQKWVKSGRSRPARAIEPIVEHKGLPFPRRALFISVHNYLYANPVQPGPPVAGSRNVNMLRDRVASTLRIPFNQVAHLSDAANKGNARPPMKAVIEQTLTNFLDSSRAQDRLLVFFIGHAAEVGDEVYLVPIEGELDNAASLIPLKWVYEKLASCKARQKILVADVCRFSLTNGAERPGADIMSPKIDAAFKNPPGGVQVLTSCEAGQRSYETDDQSMGVFLHALCETLEDGIQGRIQKPEESLPVDQLLVSVEKKMKDELHGLKQTPHLTGTEPESGAGYDKSESPPPSPVLASLPPSKGDMARTRKTIESVLDEIGVPPVKPGRDDTGLRLELLPPLAESALAKYEADKPAEKSKVREAVAQAQAILYAINTKETKPPAALAGEVNRIRGALRVDLSVLRDGYRNREEKALKTDVLNDQREVAKIFGQLEEAYEKLQDAKDDREKETRRWQANFDYMVARVEAQIAFIYEYQSMLGLMRKELPPLDINAGQNGWRLAAQPKLSGDAKGKKLAQNAIKTFDKIIKDHAGTPWEVLAKRAKLTALGLEWQATRN